MMVFDSVDELINFLVKDSRRNVPFPTRFINVENLSDFTRLKNFFEARGTEFIFLSDFCSANDTLPNLRRLRSRLKILNHDVCVLPLSEYLRVQPGQAVHTIENFFGLNDDLPCSHRIYFLMYRFENLFYSVECPDVRKKNCVLSAKSSTSDDFSLTILAPTLRFYRELPAVDGFKAYLKFFESAPESKLTLFTANAESLQAQNFFDNVKVFVDPFELLRQKFSLPRDFQPTFGRDDDWLKLAQLISVDGSFERAFCREFAIDKFNVRVLENFGERNDFQQWLLWLRCKLMNVGYVYRCANESSSPSDFVERLFGEIISCRDAKNFDELCAERREILSVMKILPPEKFFSSLLTTDKILALKVLVCNSLAEKIFLFKLLQNFTVDALPTVLPILHRTFPPLEKYLSDTQNFSEEYRDYFRHYRWLKVTNTITADFFHRVEELTRLKGRNFFTFDSRNKIIGDEYSDDAAIFFVDGMGVEYLNFIAADLASFGENFSVKYRVGFCNLPSVTELNKDFLQGRNVAADILDLDTLKHQTLPYPENILSELNFFDLLKEKILLALNSFKKIIICSDHGASRLAVLARKSDFDHAIDAENRTVYKNGRFADASPDDEKNFPTALEFDGKIIFADYSRFIQRGSTGNEIHGGATLEEVLVPVITIQRTE